MRLTALLLSLAPTALFAEGHGPADYLSYGPRPAYLIAKMAEGPLKDELMSCSGQTPQRTDCSSMLMQGWISVLQRYASSMRPGGPPRKSW